MYDFNCDVAQSYGIYQKNAETEYEIASYCSSINIASGFHAGDPLSIRKALLYAQDHNVAINVHVGYPDIQGYGERKMVLDKDELEAIVLYQISAVCSYAKTFDLEVEGVRCHGALMNELNENEESALVIVNAVKKASPWLNLIVQNQKTKELVEQNGLKAALEYEFNSQSSIREVREAENALGSKIDTIHFSTLDEVKRAWDIVKPAPINYARVEQQI